MAVAYDLVLEDHILAHQGVKRRQRPFGREIAEMVRYAVGYQSRAFVTFGAPIPLDRLRRADARRDVLELAHLVRDTIGRLLQGAADGGGRRGDAAVDHAARSRGARRGDHRDRCGRRRQPGRHVRTRGGRGRRADRSRPRHHHRRARRPLPRPRADRAALLRAHARAPAHRPQATPRTH